MKRTILLLLSLSLLAGCSASQIPTATQSADSVNRDSTTAAQTPSAIVKAPPSEQEASANMTKKPSDLATIAEEMIVKKADPFQVLEIYKKMIGVYPANGTERHDTLRYILDANLAMVKDGKGQDALRLALELDKLIPNDFYVQNRVIGAYRTLVEEQIEKKNLTAAMEFMKKGLMVRFDVEMMRTNLKLLKLMAQDDIKNKKIESAKERLSMVLYIIDAQDSEAEKDIFAKEKAEALRILSTL